MRLSSTEYMFSKSSNYRRKGTYVALIILIFLDFVIKTSVVSYLYLLWAEQDKTNTIFSQILYFPLEINSVFNGLSVISSFQKPLFLGVIFLGHINGTLQEKKKKVICRL